MLTVVNINPSRHNQPQSSNTNLLALGEEPECRVLLFTEPEFVWVLESTELTLLAFKGDITDPWALFEVDRRGWVVERL